jgi:CheY-like chemotaxis protein
MSSQVSSLETGNPTTVLLIDDNYEHRKYWSAALRNSPFHYSVFEADSGDSGLDLYRHNRVDCVVLDLDMPESGFFVLLRLIQERKSPYVAVVVLTQLMHPTLWALMKDNGAYACLIKQHSSGEELANTIQQAIVSVKSTQDGA